MTFYKGQKFNRPKRKKHAYAKGSVRTTLKQRKELQRLGESSHLWDTRFIQLPCGFVEVSTTFLQYHVSIQICYFWYVRHIARRYRSCTMPSKAYTATPRQLLMHVKTVARCYGEDSFLQKTKAMIGVCIYRGDVFSSSHCSLIPDDVLMERTQTARHTLRGFLNIRRVYLF